MKKSLVILVSLFMLIIPNKIKADAGIFVGSNDILFLGESREIGGGEISYLKDNVTNEYILTLDNVDLTTFYEYDTDSDCISDSARSIYYNFSDLTIKLVGKNTMTFNNEDGSAFTDYIAVGSSSYKIKVIGTGSLTITATNLDNIKAFSATSLEIGEEGTEGPTINMNLVGTDGASFITLMQDVKSIYNTNITAKVKGSLVAGIFNDIDSTETTTIKNSDISIVSTTGIETNFISNDPDNLIIENTDMLLKSRKDSGAVIIDTLGITSSKLLKIKDSRIVEVLDGDNIALRTIGSTGVIEFDHTDNKEFLYLANGKMHTQTSVAYNNIADNMTFGSDTSLYSVLGSATANLKNQNNVVITTGVDNKLVSGDNQTFRKNVTTSYSFVTNHYRYLVENIKLDSTVLDEEDYELSKDGKVTFTSTGLAKLNAATNGTHTIEVNYYYGSKITLSLKIVPEDYVEEDNPKTGDNITENIVIVILSLLSLIGSGIILNKKYN